MIPTYEVMEGKGISSSKVSGSTVATVTLEVFDTQTNEAKLINLSFNDLATAQQIAEHWQGAMEVFNIVA